MLHMFAIAQLEVWRNGSYRVPKWASFRRAGADFGLRGSRGWQGRGARGAEARVAEPRPRRA